MSFISEFPNFNYNKKIVIILKGREYIFEVEQRFIVNLFKIFENYVTDIIATLEY